MCCVLVGRRKQQQQQQKSEFGDETSTRWNNYKKHPLRRLGRGANPQPPPHLADTLWDVVKRGREPSRISRSTPFFFLIFACGGLFAFVVVQGREEGGRRRGWGSRITFLCCWNKRGEDERSERSERGANMLTPSSKQILSHAFTYSSWTIRTIKMGHVSFIRLLKVGVFFCSFLFQGACCTSWCTPWVSSTSTCAQTGTCT